MISLAIKCLTRSHRFRRAMKRLNAMVEELPDNTRDMSPAEHAAWIAMANKIQRHSKRLFAVGKRWGEM